MNVAMCQMNSTWEDKPANYKHVEAMLARTPVAPGSLFVLPEMFATGFSLNLDATVESPDGPTAQFLSALAAKHKFYVFGSQNTPGSSGSGKGRNEVIVFAPDGRLISRYTKLQPFSGAGESAKHESGPCTVQFEMEGWKVSPFICYDLRFPEIFRHAARKGSELIVVIAAWPYPRDLHWTSLLQARAIENLAYVVGVNRAGTDPQFKYPGRSMVVHPQGTVLTDAGTGEGIFQVEIDLTTVRSWREKFPPLRDIRSDFLPPV